MNRKTVQDRLIEAAERALERWWTFGGREWALWRLLPQGVLNPLTASPTIEDETLPWYFHRAFCRKCERVFSTIVLKGKLYFIVPDYCEACR